ncbi:ATP-grasp domain-containing protein [Streptomyces sp. NPDC006923]|uniref:ATP-grasp domain-containing protein n=1 Tax=Streptomyces sp. NPDC006923 TaxID=3155355 RepID=UPI0033EFDE34
MTVFPDNAAPRRRLLVTGVGGAPGLDLAACLASAGHTVLGTDSNPLAPGLIIPGISSRIAARADSPQYKSDLRTLLAGFRPEAIISGVERELPLLIEMQDELDAAGIRTWLPSARTAAITLDKALFHEAVTAEGIPTPLTARPEDIHLLPETGGLVVKPRRGQGSKDVHYCATRRQAAVLCELVADPIVQQRIAGQEFSADCLVDRDGRTSVVLRRRLLVHGGMSMVASTFHHEKATQLVKTTLTAIGSVGPCDVQGFITDDHPVPVVITEVNHRLAAGFRLSEAAGADLVGQTLNGLFNIPVDHQRLAYRSDVHLTKYVTELSTQPRPQQPPRSHPCPTNCPSA